MRGKNILLIALITVLCVSAVNVSIATNPTKVFVYPPIVTGLLPGATFQIAIRISDAFDVSAWELQMSYAPYANVLSITDVIEGNFLKAAAPPDGTYMTDTNDAFAGLLQVGATFKNTPETGVSGSGILCIIRFIILEAGDSDFDLHDTILLDPAGEGLPHDVEDGYYLGPMADLIPSDLPTERPVGGGHAQREWVVDMMHRWGTTMEFEAEVTNPGYADLYTRNKYTLVNQHTGETVTLYSGQEYFPTVTYRTEVLYVNEEIPVFDQWTKYGTSPYLDAAGDGSYIEAYDDGMLSNAYGFEDVSLTPYDKIIDVVVEGYTQYPGGPDGDMDMDTYCFTPSDYQFAWLGSLYGGSEWSWKTPRWIGDHVSDVVPPTTTEAGLNDFSVLFLYWTADGLPHGDMRIDQLRLVVQIETGGVYQMTGPWFVCPAGETIVPDPAVWHLEEQNTGKWTCTESVEYRWYPPEFPSILYGIGKTTFTYEYWVKGEGAGPKSGVSLPA